MKPLIIPLVALASGFAGLQWNTESVPPVPHPRHEAAFAAADGRFYLMGGRRIQPTDCFDPSTGLWKSIAKPPLEIHHFQPLVRGHEIWVIGALTGKFPNETPVPEIHIYDTRTDAWRKGPVIPEDRRRGGAGVVEHEGKIYLVCGIQRGHMGGFVPWLDCFDPATGTWQKLADAPHARDHFQSVIVDGKIYNAGGRRTSHETKELMSLTVPEVDVYDMASGAWSTLKEPIPTPRAGTSSIAIGNSVVVAGGESATQPLAHNEVESLDTRTGAWSALPPLQRGRHGSGLIFHDGKLFTASGSGRRGGQPELDSMESIKLPDSFIK
ncbi:MAG: hypothetical protein MUF13_14185 [Akkermansiaceae bacterium]|jgi:N-acetylneuraminic acid mutarotase|nr:hypothetical protein [Akkermansiaceae bacterium]